MKRRQRAIRALIVIASAITARELSDVRFFGALNLKAVDAHFVLRGALPPSNIVLIAADQEALDKLPELRMFWHPYYAEAIRAAGAAGAKVIGLDVAFGVPVTKWEPDYDRLLAEAVSTSPTPVVCGFVSEFNSNPESRLVPINLMCAALGLSAFSNLTADSQDDFVRRQELIEAPSGNPNDAPPFKSLALRIAEKYLNTEAAFQNGHLTLDGHEVPISPDRSVVIGAANPPDTLPSISLATIVNAARTGKQDQLRQWLGGKIVLIGSKTVDDRYATPFYSVLSGPRWTTAGAEIQANAVRTLLERRYLLDVPEWARWAALLVAAVLAAAIANSFAAGPAAAWIVVEVAGIFVFTHLLFRAGWIVPTAEISIAALICVVLSIGYRMLTAERRGNLFRKAVSLFVGKELASSLDRTEAIALSGRRINATVLFTDIRGFTAYTERVCEEQGPEAVVDQLNEYMELMVSIIVKHNGHVNKFIGDGILAVFSDDDLGALPGDHPARTVTCATEIVTAPSQFKTGAGIHTGILVVGNVGSAHKMEYTFLGDTVNLASRLESLNKEHKTRLLMSEATYRLLGDAVETVHLGNIGVRGKSVPIGLYTVASLVTPEAPVHA